MGVDYAGVLDFEEEDKAEESIDEFGLTMLQRTWSGPRYALADFLQLLHDGDRDDEFSDLTLVYRRVSIRYDGPFAVVTLPFKGIRGVGLTAKRRKGLVRKSVSLIALNGATATITYLAAFSTYKYATEAEPTSPRFLGKMLTLKGSQLRSVEGPAGTTVRAESSPLAADFRYRVEVIQTVFDVTEEGASWQVEETNEIELFDARRVASPRLF